MAADEVRVFAVRGMGEIGKGDSVASAILLALDRQQAPLQPGDILVIKHKIISKAEGRLVALDSVRPGPVVRRRARLHKLDARAMQLALDNAKRVVRDRHGVLITETAHGLICANSGVDLSNVDGGKSALLLPVDPDRSAARIYRNLHTELGFRVPIIISDTFGRPWHEGLTDVAIGVAGMKVFRDYRAQRDPYGYRLRVSLEAAADELASIAGLVCGKLSHTPACVIRGYKYESGRGRARDLLRVPKRDLFR